MSTRSSISNLSVNDALLMRIPEPHASHSPEHCNCSLEATWRAARKRACSVLLLMIRYCRLVISQISGPYRTQKPPEIPVVQPTTRAAAQRWLLNCAVVHKAGQSGKSVREEQHPSTSR